MIHVRVRDKNRPRRQHIYAARVCRIGAGFTGVKPVNPALVFNHKGTVMVTRLRLSAAASAEKSNFHIEYL
jgi:hypothetical protein